MAFFRTTFLSQILLRIFLDPCKLYGCIQENLGDSILYQPFAEVFLKE